MTGEGSITRWICELQDGCPQAAGDLWRAYYERLIRLAHKQLGAASRRVADEEDVVLHAFNSFCQGAAAGRFPKLEDRGDMWQILVMLTARKSADQIKEQYRAKRGGGKIRGESVFAADSSSPAAGIDQVAADDPSPEFACQLTEEYRHLLQLLDDANLQEIAIARMEGFTNAEIAGRLGVQTRTIERKLRLIREIWSAQI